MAAADLKKQFHSPRAALLTIGDELLTGRTLNTNAAFLGGELTRLGFHVCDQHGCRDDRVEIQACLKQLRSADLLIVTGGLGPTPDDVTREAIAAFFSVPLRFSPLQFKTMSSIYRKLGRKMPALCRREAYYPAHAKPLVNRFGIALGFWIQNQKQILIVLPGVPTELQKMFTHDVKPLLKKKFMNLLSGHTLIARMVGISEPRIIEKLGKDFFNLPFQFGIYPSEGETQICIRSPSKKIIHQLKIKIHKKLRRWIYSWDDQTLPELIGEILVKKKKTVAVAESCTGGSLSFAWTQHAGASRFFYGGATVYHSSAKVRIGVSSQTIQKHGEVSPQVAAELANCARYFWTSTYGIGITGIAGPSGGTKTKPVGLVYIALSTPNRTHVERQLFWGNRNQIQRKAVIRALEQLWRLLRRP